MVLGGIVVNKYAIVNASNVVENICLWDGVTEWLPCHSDDRVIEIGDASVQAGDIFNEDQTFTRPEPVIPDEVITE